MADALTPITSRCRFGRTMRDTHFMLAPTYTPLNHGSFGTYPKPVQKRLHECQTLSEARPDNFQRYDYPVMLDRSRAAMASFLNVPVDEVVFVPNATTAINVVLENLRFKKGEVILHLSTLYGSVAKMIEYIHETRGVESVNVAVEYPIDDDVLVSRFQTAINDVKDGKRRRVGVAIFDTISSLPGVRVPWERLVEVCREENVLSLVDGAHGVGQIDLGLSKVQPDFFTSNCHKWLYVPRACAVFHVPRRNQHLIRTSLPTSHGFVPRPRGPGHEIMNPLMKDSSSTSPFALLFEFVATLDVSPYLCIEEALRFRREVCGGEEKIMRYCEEISSEAGRQAAEILGTGVMENGTKMLTKCAFTNVRLPLEIGDGPEQIPEKDMYLVAVWMTAMLVRESDIYSPVFFHARRFWTRLSGQVYLDLGDFEKGARALKTLCDRAKSGEYLQQKARL
ncbi:hypothetical protein HO173_009166 [Letharia columbiana]|uniref:Aminotransferase class V domain-containing protein n=1 Tax=Letharia columbiana TaxID=112416 RepID=A0A8H6FPT8_9LECA|nr:uncharacterized protein HO173_009166 [Letharia columbiana]KAF6232500.1 hypothetical protein HO173_009166 [Letharia columbiana]